MSATCPVCECEQAEGLLCHNDTSRLERELGDVAAIVAELDTTISKQARLGPSGKGAPARERTPVNWGAVAVADDLQNTLTTWARDVGQWDRLASINMGGSVAASYILLGNVDAIRRHPAVVELVDEISDAIAQARRAVDRPADRVYLGQCMVETPDEEGRQVTCLAELNARPGASEVTCGTCGIHHNVLERRAEMLKQAEDMILSVRDASYVLGEVGGIKVSQASIRGYVHRGKIAYRPGVTNGIRVGDLLAVVIDEGEKKSA